MGQVRKGAVEWPRVRIDPNVSVRDGLTRTKLRNATETVSVGQAVTAFEAEDGSSWLARVVAIEDGFIFLRVDWSTLADDPMAAYGVTLASFHMVDPQMFET